MTARTVPRAAPPGEHGGVRGGAQGAVDDDAQGALAGDVADGEARVVLADGARADDDGVVGGAQLVGEA